MTKEEIAELRRLAQKASPGPWVLTVHTCGDDDGFDPQGDDWTLKASDKQVVADEQWSIRLEANVRFIEAVNPKVVLDLLRRLEAAEAETLAAVKRAIELAAREAWNREPDEDGPIEVAIRALPADEIARGEK